MREEVYCCLVGCLLVCARGLGSEGGMTNVCVRGRTVNNLAAREWRLPLSGSVSVAVRGRDRRGSIGKASGTGVGVGEEVQAGTARSTVLYIHTRVGCIL